jgi:sigma-54 specific flagellar transcriptional regulator A
VRIIAATHRDLEAAISAGRFREDLYYRLNVFPIQMPPLRERLEDLPVLIEHLVQRQGQISGRHIRLDKEAMNCLARNPWPGNVRELANLLERLAILFPEQTITATDLPERYRNKGTTGWFASGMRIVPPAPGVLASASSALLEELLEAGESELSDSLEMADTVELLDRVDLADRVSLVDGLNLVDSASRVNSVSCVDGVGLAERVELADFAERPEAANTALPRGGIDLKDHLSTIEIGLIRQALEEADGTVAEAARLLGMRRTTLVEKLRKYRLSA